MDDDNDVGLIRIDYTPLGPMISVAADFVVAICVDDFVDEPPCDPEYAAHVTTPERAREALILFSQIDLRTEAFVFTWQGRDYSPSTRWVSRYRDALLRRRMP